MKNYLHTLGACALLVSSAQAATITLDMTPTGTTASGTDITTAVSIYGTTFDLTYTITSISKADTTSYIETTAGGQVGVGWNGDVGTAAEGTFDSSGHVSTIEAADSEGLSFTNLTISNFNAGSSSLTISDFSDIAFSSISFNNAGNAGDRVNTSYNSFGADTIETNLRPLGATPTLDLTDDSNYPDAGVPLYAKNLYIEATSSARWAVTGLEVTTSAVPEPSSTALLGLGGLALILRRRK